MNFKSGVARRNFAQVHIEHSTSDSIVERSGLFEATERVSSCAIFSFGPFLGWCLRSTSLAIIVPDYQRLIRGHLLMILGCHGPRRHPRMIGQYILSAAG